MTVKVLFLGILAEISGSDSRFYNSAGSTGELMIMICDDIPEIIHYNFRIILNNDIIDGNHLLNDNDEVVLLPPFEGG